MYRGTGEEASNSFSERMRKRRGISRFFATWQSTELNLVQISTLMNSFRNIHILNAFILQVMFLTDTWRSVALVSFFAGDFMSAASAACQNIAAQQRRSRRAAAGRAQLLANFFGGAVWGVFRENANCGDPGG